MINSSTDSSSPFEDSFDWLLNFKYYARPHRVMSEFWLSNSLANFLSDI